MIELNGIGSTLVYPAPPHSHFKDVNVIGADFCSANSIISKFDCGTKEAILIFPDLSPRSVAPDDQRLCSSETAGKGKI